jgi:hypothetical protein
LVLINYIFHYDLFILIDKLTLVTADAESTLNPIKSPAFTEVVQADNALF